MDQKLRQDIEQFVEEQEQQIIRDIARLVAVNSVEGESAPGAPYGPGPKQALELALQIAEELGLETRNCENMIGYASVGGQGDRYLATITHVDVVPATDGWQQDPFTLREREGYLIGRGVMDDKGPSILCLYALKYLKDRKIPLRYPVRALLGANEETGMQDVEYYLKNEPEPLFCFSPDADFPLCNGEKGILHGRMISNLPLGKIVDIRGGVAANAVPDKAEAWVRAESLEGTDSVEVAEEEPGLWHLTAHGVSGHASMPEGTVNAIGLLVDYLLERDLAVEEEARFLRLVQLLNSASDGSGLGVQASDGRFTPLTIVGGVIGVENGRMFQTIDSRYPTSTSGEKIVSIIREKAGDAAELVIDADSEPFYMELDNPAVQVCIRAYNDVTGEQAEPYTIGGGTYARHMKNAVSFGPEHPERPQPDFAGPIHGVDEAASKAYLLEALKVYILALLELEKLDF